MSIEFKIEKFKRVNEEVVFKDFSPINYFVGENGSGKTSILSALSYLNEDSNARILFGPESLVELIYNGKKKFLSWNEENPNRIENNGELIVNLYMFGTNQSEGMGSNGIRGKIGPNNRVDVGNKESLSKFNIFLKSFDFEDVVAKFKIDESDPFNQDNGSLIFVAGEREINPNIIAEGLRMYYLLVSNLMNWISYLNENKDRSNDVTIVLFEELENNLHPSLQKKIPNLLDRAIDELSSDISENVFFFVSTHSPFVIGASAKYKNQKVFPLQNGKPLELDLKNQTWVESNSSEGYFGEKCAYVVSKMLGADITDIGYPENYCILEEYSLQIILDNARDKGIIRNIQFVSASGISKSIDLSNTIYELEKLDTLIKCNPYYFDKYLLIIDSMENVDDAKLKKRVNKISDRIGDRFIELSNHSLEEYYSNLDKDISDKVQTELESKNSEDISLIKANYAKKISDRVNSPEDFSKLFNNELDLLIR